VFCNPPADPREQARALQRCLCENHPLAPGRPECEPLP
jgi:hypothetical protein